MICKKNIDKTTDFCYCYCSFTHCVYIYIGEIHYHKENKTNGGKQIEFSAESNQFEKKIKNGNK